MKTPEEIKRGLEMCTRMAYSDECPYFITGCRMGNMLMRDALLYIQQLEAQVPRWISVEERLPEPFVPVLVLMPDEKPHPIVREGYVTRKGKWRAGLYDRDPDEITHWMPMPKPQGVDDHG